MSTTTAAVPSAPAARLTAPSGAAAMFLAFGPVATVLLITWASRGGLLDAMPLHQYVYVALLMWSPLPFTIPAVVLEAHRDAALPDFRGVGRLLRGFLLMPAMLVSGSARLATAASLVGFAVSVLMVVAVPELRV